MDSYNKGLWYGPECMNVHSIEFTIDRLVNWIDISVKSPKLALSQRTGLSESVLTLEKFL